MDNPCKTTPLSWMDRCHLLRFIANLNQSWVLAYIIIWAMYGRRLAILDWTHQRSES